MKSLIAVLHAAPHDERSKLVTSILEKQGILYKLYTDMVWHGLVEKIKTALRASQELTEYEYILFLDAYDVIALAGPDEILERYKAFNHLWVCAAELNLWPPDSIPREAYEGETLDPFWKRTPYRYLNSGMYLARREYLRECLESWNIPDEIFCDQYWFATQYLAHPGAILLDTHCQLFQCLISSWWAFDVSPGKLYNNYTNTYPLLLHHNGGGKLTGEKIRPLWENM